MGCHFIVVSNKQINVLGPNRLKLHGLLAATLKFGQFTYQKRNIKPTMFLSITTDVVELNCHFFFITIWSKQIIVFDINLSLSHFIALFSRDKSINEIDRCSVTRIKGPKTWSRPHLSERNNENNNLRQMVATSSRTFLNIRTCSNLD